MTGRKTSAYRKDGGIDLCIKHSAQLQTAKWAGVEREWWAKFLLEEGENPCAFGSIPSVYGALTLETAEAQLGFGLDWKERGGATHLRRVKIFRRLWHERESDSHRVSWSEARELAGTAVWEDEAANRPDVKEEESE